MAAGEIYAGLDLGEHQHDGAALHSALTAACDRHARNLTDPAAELRWPAHGDGPCSSNRRGAGRLQAAPTAPAMRHAPILHVYRRLRGPFAFSYWHEARQALYLAKDPLGRRSLLAQQHAHGLRVTSVAPRKPGADASPPSRDQEDGCEKGTEPGGRDAQYHEVPPGLYVLERTQCQLMTDAPSDSSEHYAGGERQCKSAGAPEAAPGDGSAVTSPDQLCALVSATGAGSSEEAAGKETQWRLACLTDQQIDTDRRARLCQRRSSDGAIQCSRESLRNRQCLTSDHAR